MRRLLLLLIGIALIGFGIFMIVQGNALAKRCTVEAVGTIIEVTRESSTDSDGFTSYTYYPVIEYKAGEETVTQKGSNGGDASSYKVNDTIDILYNPDNVSEFIVKGDKTSNIIGIFAIVAGVLVLFGFAKTILFGR